MQIKTLQDPNYDYKQLLEKGKQQCSNPKGGIVEQSFFYLDPLSAKAWSGISHRSKYISTFDNLTLDWPEWITQTILQQIQTSGFDPNKVDVIGLGMGDGYKELLLSRGLDRTNQFHQLRCFLLDLSPELVKESQKSFEKEFAGRPHVQAIGYLGDFHHLSEYKDIFYRPEDQNILRVGTMFGTLVSLRTEKQFIEECSKAFKPKDLLLIDVSLGFAPHDRPDLIQEKDPFFQGQSSIEWIGEVFRRYHNPSADIRFDFSVKQGESIFPNTYTLEIQAITEEQTKFSLFQRHRYSAKEFIETFAELGWKPLQGRQYGYDNRQLIYIFAKD